MSNNQDDNYFEDLQRLVVKVSTQLGRTESLVQYLRDEVKNNNDRQTKATDENREHIKEIDQKVDHLHECMHESDLGRTRENGELKAWIAEQLDEIHDHNREQDLRRELGVFNQMKNAVVWAATKHPKITIFIGVAGLVSVGVIEADVLQSIVKLLSGQTGTE